MLEFGMKVGFENVFSEANNNCQVHLLLGLYGSTGKEIYWQIEPSMKKTTQQKSSISTQYWDAAYISWSNLHNSGKLILRFSLDS